MYKGVNAHLEFVVLLFKFKILYSVVKCWYTIPTKNIFFCLLSQNDAGGRIRLRSHLTYAYLLILDWGNKPTKEPKLCILYN